MTGPEKDQVPFGRRPKRLGGKRPPGPVIWLVLFVCILLPLLVILG